MFSKQEKHVLCFMFGQPRSGKSTLCAAITLFLMDDDDLVVNTCSVENKRGALVIREWVDLLRAGQFPLKTERDTYINISLRIKNQRGETLKITFLEVAGGDVTMLDPLNLRHEHRSKDLDTWLHTASAIVFLAPTKPTSGDRFVLQTFSEFLEANGINKPTLLLLTGWDRVKETGIEPGVFVNDNYKEVGKYLKSIGADLQTFSIGKVGPNDESIIEFKPTAGTVQVLKWLLDI